MDTESIPIVDCIPFMTKDYDGSETHKESHNALLEALEIKRPDIGISCFRTKTQNKF